LEAASSKGVIEILRMRPDGGVSMTEIRWGRVTRRRELAPEEADRLSAGAVKIERSYAPPTSEARDDLPPTEKI